MRGRPSRRSRRRSCPCPMLVARSLLCTLQVGVRACRSSGLEVQSPPRLHRAATGDRTTASLARRGAPTPGRAVPCTARRIRDGMEDDGRGFRCVPARRPRGRPRVCVPCSKAARTSTSWAKRAPWPTPWCASRREARCRDSRRPVARRQWRRGLPRDPIEITGDRLCDADVLCRRRGAHPHVPTRVAPGRAGGPKAGALCSRERTPELENGDRGGWPPFSKHRCLGRGRCPNHCGWRTPGEGRAESHGFHPPHAGAVIEHRGQRPGRGARVGAWRPSAPWRRPWR